MTPSESIAAALIHLNILNQDRASKRNGVGFNSTDTDICSKLAVWAETKPLSEAQAKLALKKLVKYQHTQLGHIQLPDVAEVEAEFRAKSLMKAARPVIHEIVLDPDNMIAVVNEPFDYGIMELCRSMGGTFQATTARKAWRFRRVKLRELHEALPNFELDAELTAEMEMIWEKERLDSKAKQDARSLLSNQLNLNQKFGSFTLREHQKEGVAWALDRERGILAFEPGTGKTAIGVVWAKAHTALGRSAFVISPKSVVSVWGETAADMGVPISIYTRHYLKIPKPLEESEYVVVVDEVHNFKNPKAKSTQNLLELTKHVNCKGVLLLTGTPMMNGRPVELEPLLAMVQWPELSPFDSKAKAAYERKYCNAHQEFIGSQRIWVTSDIPPEPILRELRLKIMAVDGKGGYLFHKKADDCLDLPPMTQRKVKVVLDTKERQEYERKIREAREAYQKAATQREETRISDIERAIGYALEAGDTKTAAILERAKKEKPQDAALLVGMGQLRRCGGEAKVAACLEMIDELTSAGEQVVVFTSFVEAAHDISAGCADLESGGVLASFIDGSISVAVRDQRKDAFQKGDLRVLVCTYGAGSEGITLTAARHMILVDLPWTPGKLEQARKRIHRITQERATFTTVLSLDKIDEMMYTVLMKKQASIDTLLTEDTEDTEDMMGEALKIAKEILK